MSAQLDAIRVEAHGGAHGSSAPVGKDSYASLIERRRRAAHMDGPTVRAGDIHASLKPFQRRIVTWAARVGRPAVWADTGLGKTRMQLEWCRVAGAKSLIVTPLAVAEQTVEEAAKIGIVARYVRSAGQVDGDGIYVTNYEMVPHLRGVPWDAVALDESSILKQSDGKTRTMLIEAFAETPFRSAWSATPAPNDPAELTSQAEFLGHSTRDNMLAAYFIHDSDGWRLKGHALDPMCQWMTSWAMAVRKPSDMGDSNVGYDLPGLDIISEPVEADVTVPDGELFAYSLGGVGGRAQVRRETLAARVKRAAELVAAEPDEPWLIWCGLNDEADALARAIPGAVNVHGGLSPEDKARELMAFAHGQTRVLITKPSIAGMGLNFQGCARMAFVGLSDSYEAYYQCIRRCYRFGQQRVVKAHIVLSEIEGQIAANVRRKETEANRVVNALVAHRMRMENAS